MLDDSVDSRKLKSFDSSACSSKSSRPTPAAPPTAAPDNRRDNRRDFSQLYSHEHLTTQQQHQQQQKYVFLVARIWCPLRLSHVNFARFPSGRVQFNFSSVRIKTCILCLGKTNKQAGDLEQVHVKLIDTHRLL